LPLPLKTDKVLKLVEIDKRKLRYWCDLHLVKPYLKSTGKGVHAEFDLENIVHLYIIRELSESGLTTKAIQNIMNEVRKHDINTLSRSVIITNGKDFVEVSTRIDFKRALEISPLFVMRIKPLQDKAIRNMEMLFS
jgi:DNA-binding transcriptional MerR regulator